VATALRNDTRNAPAKEADSKQCQNSSKDSPFQRGPVARRAKEHVQKRIGGALFQVLDVVVILILVFVVTITIF
jgi:hypothetical protein